MYRSVALRGWLGHRVALDTACELAYRYPGLARRIAEDAGMAAAAAGDVRSVRAATALLGVL